MYLCIVHVVGDPQENHVREIRYFDTLKEAKQFKLQTADFNVCVDIFKAKHIG